MARMELTAKQQCFVEEYLVDLNATQAAVRAGYSQKTAKSVGCEILTKPDIQEAISIARADRSKRTRITADMVINGLLKEAQSTNDGSTQSARVAAWAHLGRHLAIFTDKTENKTTVETGDSLLALMSEIDGKTRSI